MRADAFRHRKGKPLNLCQLLEQILADPNATQSVRDKAQALYNELGCSTVGTDGGPGGGGGDPDQ